MSTGAGPITYYASVGGPTRRGNSRPMSRVTATTPAQQEKAALAIALADEIESLQTRHAAVSFPPMKRPIARVDMPPTGRSLAFHRKQARSGVPWYDLKGHRLARAAAATRAAADDHAAEERALLERRNRQEELDAFWNRLVSNDPDTVLPFVQQAFEDNDDPAAIVGLEGDEAYIAVLAPDEDVVPDRMPGVTPTGRPSIRKMSAKDRALLHQQAVAGTLLLTIMEAFAVAPGLGSVKIAALERGHGVSFVWSVRIRRSQLEQSLSDGETSLEVLDDAADENDYRLVGAAKRLAPLEPADIGWVELQHALLRATEDELR